MDNILKEIAEENGYTFIHPFDDLAVATGQGSIAMEIFKELPLVEYILVPIGGGGLATGISTLAKMLNPNIKVIAVEPAESPLISEGHAGPHGIQGIGANFVPKILNTNICTTSNNIKLFYTGCLSYITNIKCWEV